MYSCPLPAKAGNVSYTRPLASIKKKKEKAMFKPNIGNEFKKQMEIWFKEHPEISHEWEENQLRIIHPKQSGNYITFKFDSKSLKIEHIKKVKTFHSKYLKKIDEQVLEIRGFWINEFLTKEDTEIKKPKLKENQIAAMFCNSKYGQVLTTNKNIFTGWGNVYQIFENKEDAKKFFKKESTDDKIEIHFYNSKYESIEIKKED